jgi:hypothetical protein
MSASSTSSLAGALERSSLEGCTSSTSGKNPPHQATLLGIPQELCNKIFEHVYGLFDAPGGHVALMLSIEGVYCPEIPEAAVESSEAPPSKSPILVCRQLYTEMKRMQAEAFRQYWSNNTFDASSSGGLHNTTDMLYAVADHDLEHVKHFNILDSCDNVGVAVMVLCRFEAGKWTAAFSVSDRLWKCICDCNGRNRRGPRGPHRLISFDEEMRRQTSTHASTTMDPDLGTAFTAKDMCTAVRVVHTMILLGPSRRWAAI